jgi:hypothetical protein
MNFARGGGVLESVGNNQKTKEYSMTSVSARSYVAAGLATAIAGVAVASPVLAQSQFHLPAVSGNVELASEVSAVAQHAVSTGAVEVKQIGDAVLHVMASVPHEAATAATTLPGGPLVKQAAVTAVARAVTAVIAANQASSITVHRDSAASPAVSAALPGLPDLQGILGVPLLVADIPVDIAQAAVKGVNEATRGLSNVLFGLGTGDQDEVQFGISQITSAIPDAINRAVGNVQADVNAIEAAVGFNTDAVDSAAVARVVKMADAKNPGAVAVAPKSLNPPKAAAPTKADPTKADPTKGTDTTKGDATADATKGTDSTKPDSTKPDTTKDTTAESSTKPADSKPDTTKPSDHSSTAEHHNAPSTANAAAANKGATKAGASAHNGHTAGAASHPGGSAAKHSAGAGAGAGAKKGGAKGGK